MTSFSETYLAETAEIARRLDAAAVERLARALCGDSRRRRPALRPRRRRLRRARVARRRATSGSCAAEAYAPTDNVAELTAPNQRRRLGRCACGLARGLACRRRGRGARLLGRRRERGARRLGESGSGSRDSARAGARVFGVVGRDGGYTRAVADESVLVPVASDERVTPTPKACAPSSGTCS